jgi:hypothetical protein
VSPTRKRGNAVKRPANERPADLRFWLKSGSCSGCDAPWKAEMKVSVGRTDSKRALGFWVSKRDGGTHVADFVLDRHQAAELAAYLSFMADYALAKPLGPRAAGRPPTMQGFTGCARRELAKPKKRGPRP